MKRKIIVLSLLIAFVILSIPNTVNANAKQKEEDITVLEDSSIPLYNDKDEIIAFHYELNNGGYIIVNSDGSNFIEYSLEKTDENLSKDEKYYYNNPCSIYEKVNNSVIENCTTNEKTEIEDLDFNIKKSSSCNEKAATALATELITTAASSTIEEKKLSHATKKYNYNPDGRCGSVAGAIVLRYYNDYVNTNYVHSSYETSDGKKLINRLTDKYLGTATNYITLRDGLNDYLNNRGITSRFKKLSGRNSTSVFSRIMTTIKTDRPLIVGLTGTTTYKEHWVVGTGYSIIYTSGIGYGYIVIFNDGNGKTNVRLNLFYVDGCIYI